MDTKITYTELSEILGETSDRTYGTFGPGVIAEMTVDVDDWAESPADWDTGDTAVMPFDGSRFFRDELFTSIGDVPEGLLEKVPDAREILSGYVRDELDYRYRVFERYARLWGYRTECVSLYGHGEYRQMLILVPEGPDAQAQIDAIGTVWAQWFSGEVYVTSVALQTPEGEWLEDSVGGVYGYRHAEDSGRDMLRELADQVRGKLHIVDLTQSK